MLLQRRRPPVVFGGPSLCEVRRLYPHSFDYRPPVRRGDLHELLAERSTSRGCVLITDGVFGESLSVSPIECIDMLEAGWILMGASSMGALRAADCSRVGMVGVGDVFFSYRTGYFHSDADVAVLYDQKAQHELSVSLAHADHIVRVLTVRRTISDIVRRLILKDLRAIPWYERSPLLAGEILARRVGDPQIKGEFIALWEDVEHNPKVRDAVSACSLLSKYFLKQIA